MFFEVLAAVFGLLLLTLWGAPLAIWLGRKAGSETCASAGWILSIAPALGTAVFVLVAPPLFFLLGASARWAIYATAALTAVALVATFILVRKSETRPSLKWQEMVGVAVIAGTLLFQAAPVVTQGFNGVVFRSNPSDTISYLTLSESTRTASMKRITAGSPPGPLPDTAVLAEKNPSALYSARFLSKGNARLSTIIDLGWFAQVSGISIYRLMWSFGTIFIVAIAGAAFATARTAGVGWKLSSIAALAAGVGFWTGMVRDADALSNLQSNAILLALVAIRIADASSKKHFVSFGVASGLLLAAFISAYTELAPLAVAALVTECFVRMLDAERLKALMSFGLTLGVALAAIVVTGQGAYLASLVAAQLGFAASATGPIGGYLFEGEAAARPIEGVGGSPWLYAILVKLGLSTALAGMTTTAIGVAMMAMGAIGGIAILVRKAWRPASMIAAIAAGGTLIGLYGLILRGDPYWFLKGMASAGPFLLLLVALGAAAVGSLVPKLSPIFIRSGAWFAAILLVVQLGYAATAVGPAQAYQARYVGGRTFEFSKITSELEQRCPCKLLVNIPPSQDWWWAVFASMSLQKFKPYQQMGVFYDNKPATLLHPLLERKERPDLAVVAIEDDYIAERGLGTLIVEDAGLRLYEVTGGTAEDFAFRLPGPAAPPPAPVSTPASAAAATPSIWIDIEHENDDIVVEGAAASPMAADLAVLEPRRHVSARLFNEPVKVDEVVRVRFSTWSRTPPSKIRVTLIRHCNQDRDSPTYAQNDYDVGATPIEVELTNKFATAHDCIRVTVANVGTQRTEIYLTGVTVERP